MTTTHATGLASSGSAACAGVLAWDHARQLAASRAAAQRRLARRSLMRAVRTLGFAAAVIAWLAGACWHAHANAGAVSIGGLTVCAAVVLVAGRRIGRTVRQTVAAGRAARRLSALADADFAALVLDEDALVGPDIRFLLRAAFLRRGTAVWLERNDRGRTWWHDVQLANDPAVTFDHVGVGTGGLVVVHDIAITCPVTVDASFGLSFAGQPIGGPEHVMAWQLRAASSAARAAELPLSSATSIVVVDGAPLLDCWGAPTHLEHLQHSDSGVALVYCAPDRLAAALLTGAQVEADTTMLAATQLAAAIVHSPPDAVHQADRSMPLRSRRRRRWALTCAETRHE